MHKVPHGWFSQAAEQATRYGWQLAYLNIQFAEENFGAVWEAWIAFIEQFQGNVREVLTRTFWQAYNS
jgi:hypothetical protein